MQTIQTKKGDHLQKSRLTLMDLGPEASGGDLYWTDFLGEAALTDDELLQISRKQVQVEVRRMYASAGKIQGKAFLNATGGAVMPEGQILQRGLRQEMTQQPAQRSA